MTKKRKNFHYDEIESIECVGERETYDFKIPQTHCYYGNGVLIHNSGHLEEHADQVWIVHYPFHYTRESDDKDKYIIKIAKNREGRTGEFECTFEPEFYKIKENVQP